jgi:hypothetical protein
MRKLFALACIGYGLTSGPECSKANLIYFDSPVYALDMSEGTDEIEAVLSDMVEGYLRRADIPDETIRQLMREHRASIFVARWLVRQAPELTDDSIDVCPVEL